MKKAVFFGASSLVLAVAFFFASCAEPVVLKPKATGWKTLGDGGVLEGSYTESIEIEEDANITLKGTVKFSTDTTLKINPGVTVKGDVDVLSYLIIDRGAKIEAKGTLTKPITFTSGKAKGSRGRQDWGGIVINGYAKINKGATAQGEGDSGTYGGDKDDDNSGTLQYVKIHFAGKQFSTTNELNGLCLQGVGSGTVIDYIHSHACSDDGIEMFGGKVDFKHLIMTCNGDDNVDCTYGWRGRGQFIAVGQVNGDEGFEHDNNSSNHTAEPRGEAKYWNVTVCSDGSNSGAYIRVGMKAEFNNTLIAGASKGITLKDPDSSCKIRNSIIEGCATTYSGSVDNDGSVTVNGSWSKLNQSDFASMAALASAGANAFKPDVKIESGAGTPPDDGFYDTSAKFIGAIGDSNWIAGWTEFPEN